jgi:TIR domain
MSAASNTVSYTGSRYDVFVSYSHGDPRGIGRAPLAGWTHRLIDELRRDIETTSTEFDQLALWDDREADPTLYLTPTIKDCVNNSALLLIVMSPRYLASSWCKDELEWFGQELRQRCTSDGHTLVVRALPTQEETWPLPLKDTNGQSLLGFWFHPRPAKEGVKPFGWPDPQPFDRQFFDALSQLSMIVMQRLRKLKERAALRTSVIRTYVRSKGKPTVYLHARQGDAAAWLKTRDELIDHGFDVLPYSVSEGSIRPKNLRCIQELRRERVATYRDCDVLLILRPQPGDWINNELKTIGFDELRELDACNHKHIPCAVLDFINDGTPQYEAFNIARFAADASWPASFGKWLNGYSSGEDFRLDS